MRQYDWKTNSIHYLNIEVSNLKRWSCDSDHPYLGVIYHQLASTAYQIWNALALHGSEIGRAGQKSQNSQSMSYSCSSHSKRHRGFGSLCSDVHCCLSQQLLVGLCEWRGCDCCVCGNRPWLLWSPYVIGQTIIFSCCGLLWSPYVIGQTIIFSSCFFLLSSFFFLLSFFSSPNLSGRRLDVYHTLAHGVALVRI